MRWKGKPLASLQIQKGSWSFTASYLEAEVAKEWGKSPSEFRALSEEDRAIMWAHTVTARRMQAWEIEERERETKRDRDKPKGRR